MERCSYIMVIGVDHGNSQVKTPHSVFVSGIIAHGTAKPSIPSDTVCYKGEYYTISSKREPYKRDKTSDEKCFIMTLFALAKEIEETKQYSPNVMEVHLAVGLPPEHISKQKEKFANYFRDHGDVWEFSYNDKPYKISIPNVFVFPQAYSAVVTRVSDLKSYSTMYIVDIGGYTVDTLLLVEGKPDLQYCNSFEMGIIKMNNTIKNRVNSEYALTVDELHIRDIMVGKKTALDDDIIDFIKDAAKAHVNTMLEKLREEGVDLKTNPAMFIGGGSLALKNLILDSGFVNTGYVEFIPEVSANAIGYAMLATGTLRRISQSQSNT